MTMLSGRPSLARARKPALAKPPLFERCAQGLRFLLHGEPVLAFPEGGLWVDAYRTLIVSDLHLEKGSWFARRGQMLPPYDTRATLARIEALCAQWRPDKVVSLGDSFHDGRAHERLSDEDRKALLQRVGAQSWVWIAGNHDPHVPAALGGEVCEVLTLGALTLRHEPTCAPCDGEIAGHLHPAVRIAGAARTVRARCFATDGARLIMPAFGALTGGLDLSDDAYARVFPKGAIALAMGAGKLHPIGPDKQA